MTSNLRKRYNSALMKQFSNTTYPSTPMMDKLESSINDRETAETYVSALLDHIEDDKYPSPPMLDRVNRLIAILERQDQMSASSRRDSANGEDSEDSD